MPARRVVTLSSDVGPLYSAQMKGALAGYVPPGSVVELTHDLPRGGIAEGAFLFRQLVRAFGRPAVHVAVVDPGVGGPRAPIAIRCRDRSVLVGPDNGLLIPAREALGGGDAIRLDPARVVSGTSVSATFHGRDLFAPAAGRIASGTPLRALGDRWTPTAYSLPEPSRRRREILGQVLHVDHFGNLITNVPSDWVPETGQPFFVRVGEAQSRRLPRVRTYVDLREHALGVLGSSFGTLEVAERSGDAAVRFHAGVGSPVRLRPAGLPPTPGDRK